MADYRQVSDETRKLFYEVLDNSSIPSFIEIEITADDTLINKEGYLVRKQNGLNEYLQDGTQVVIVINEEIFDGLVEIDVKKKLLEEAIGGIEGNLETGKVTVKKHDFTTNSGFLEKYGADDVILLKLSVISLYGKKKEREDQEKADAKAAKKKQ